MAPLLLGVVVLLGASPVTADELDPTFGTGGKVTTDFFKNSDSVHSVLIQTDGKIVVAGQARNSGDVWALEASLDYGDGDPYLCVFVFEMRGGRIAKEVAYWSKPFPAPEWRAPFVERL